MEGTSRLPSPKAMAVASVLVFVGLACLLALDGDGFASPTAAAGQKLNVYVAAGLQPPVAAIAKDYEATYGVSIDIFYGGSGTLLSNLKIAGQGDIYLAADDSYIDLARQEGLVAETFAVARMKPVIAVSRGNPKGVTGLEDLLRRDLSLGLANPDAAAIGKITRELLKQAGLWKGVKEKTHVFKPTVMDLANDLLLQTIDAAVIWDATANQYPEIQIVSVPVFDRSPRNIALGILKTSELPTTSLHFARYLTAIDTGLRQFSKWGYAPVVGDLWHPEPELVLMCGAMLRSAVDACITQFEAREGVRVTRIYNGCGILTAQMQTGSKVDCYFSCDQSFLDRVEDLFGPGRTVTRNDMVLLVAKDNPKNLASLGDLLGPGLRVGLGHPEKSALGALTRKLLRRLGLEQRLQDSGNTRVESATGDVLVNQLLVGSLDASIVYRSNAAHSLERLEVIDIEDESACASQPFAIARSSKHPRLAERLFQHILRNRQAFEELGFDWRYRESGR